MELDKVIKERRSIRKFKDLDVPWQFIAECLDAAVYAPSSGNVQNFRFVVVKNKDKRHKLINDASPENKWALDAPVLIVICAELSKIRRMFNVRGEALYSVQNCACAANNFMLKAYELGLGSCWIGDFDEKKINEILNVSADARPQAIIALGYSKENGEVKRDPLDNFVYFESYGNRTDISRTFTTLSNLLKSGLNKTFKAASRIKGGKY